MKNVAKLASDFKQGEELVYINKDNNQETIIIDDEIRQADYKYTYSDRTMLAEKIAMADNLAVSIEKFAQVLPLDMAEIFTWYFEQKGVENPERFLNQEKLDKQEKTEKVQDVIQDMNIKKQFASASFSSN